MAARGGELGTLPNTTPKTKRKLLLKVLESEATPKKIIISADPDVFAGRCMTCKKSPVGHLRHIVTDWKNYRGLVRTVLLIDVPENTRLQLCDGCINKLEMVSIWRRSIIADLESLQPKDADVSVTASSVSPYSTTPLVNLPVTKLPSQPPALSLSSMSSGMTPSAPPPTAQPATSTSSNNLQTPGIMLHAPTAVTSKSTDQPLPCLSTGVASENSSLSDTSTSFVSSSEDNSLGPRTSTPARQPKSRRRLILSPICTEQEEHGYSMAEPLNISMKKELNFFSAHKVTDESEKKLLYTIDTELNMLTRLTDPSILRSQDIKDLKDPQVTGRIIKEVKDRAPHVYHVLHTICSPLHRTPEKTSETLATMYAMGMYNRDQQLSLRQRLNTAAAIRCGASNLMLDILQRQSITLVHNSKYGFLDKLGKHNDDNLVAALKRGDKIFLTIDNIDGHIVVKKMRLDYQNQDFHYAAVTVYIDLAAWPELSTIQPVVESIDPGIFFLDEDENSKLEDAYDLHIAYVCQKHFKEFKWMKKPYEHLLKEQQEHRFADIMSKKSQFFSTQVFCPYYFFRL